MDLLGVGEHIGALLGEDPRHAIEQTSLKPQGDGRARLEDGLAGFSDVDLLDCFARDLPVAGSESEGGNQPE